MSATTTSGVVGVAGGGFFIPPSECNKALHEYDYYHHYKVPSYN